MLYWLFIQQERAKRPFNLPGMLFKCIRQLKPIRKIMVFHSQNDEVNFSQDELKRYLWAVDFLKINFINHESAITFHGSRLFLQSERVSPALFKASFKGSFQWSGKRRTFCSRRAMAKSPGVQQSPASPGSADAWLCDLETVS